MNNILNILENIITTNNNTLSEIYNNDEQTNFLLALSMYINFYYEHIVSDELIMNYLVNSNRIINNFALMYPEYTRRQVESTYIAFTVCFILLFIKDEIIVDDLD